MFYSFVVRSELIEKIRGQSQWRCAVVLLKSQEEEKPELMEHRNNIRLIRDTPPRRGKQRMNKKKKKKTPKLKPCPTNTAKGNFMHH
ncbi:hypothetical protein CEXT_552151 [Caerostris extrusa]|uniref:Uncharacterized protein n=1 Tax=Caerostris extrusa TaxID=172846 RepID=A0AAV4X766_CAEEX|nr:hypothetical protein CEXT_552151 [Caerostris extrusa]